jgi:copper binding plastocyanin/azurin family protein
MLFRVLALGLLAAAGVLAAAAPAVVADTPQPLRGHTGPGFEIGLVDANGVDVKKIDTPGTYTFTIEDLSELHNFHLIGPGIDKETSIEGQGTETWTLNLAAGTYNYFCTPHATIMKGSFTVGAVATTTPPTTTTTPKPKPPPAAVQKLSAKVGAATIAFAARAKAGKAQITVRDLSGKQNFHLSGPGVNKKTGVGFTGTVKWTLTLKKGTYVFRSDAAARLRGKTKVG